MSVTTLDQHRAAPVTAPNPLMPSTFEGAMKLAEMMSRGKLVPSHLQGSPADCLLVVEQAIRFGMSPFAVAQATSVISGKLMLEGKLVAAAVHTSGALVGRLAYRFTGEGASRTIHTSGVLRGEHEPREVTVTLAEARTNNQLWNKQPDQQLVYHSTRVWARRHVPEVMLGVYSPEEMEQAPHREPAYDGQTIDAYAEPSPATSPTSSSAPVGSMREYAQQRDAVKPKPTPMQWFTARIDSIEQRQHCATLLDEGTKARALFDQQSEADQGIIRDMLANRMADFMAGPTPPADDDDFPGVVTGASA